MSAGKIKLTLEERERLEIEAHEAAKQINDYMSDVKTASDCARKVEVHEEEDLLFPRMRAMVAPLGPMTPNHLETLQPVKIEYSVGGEKHEEEFDAVMIACQPVQLEGAMKFTALEKASFDLLRNSWFFTTLVRANKPATEKEQRLSEWGNWDEALSGNIQGRREEFNARNPGPYIPDDVAKTYYTVYQQKENPAPPKTVEELQAELEKIRDETLKDKNNNFFLDQPEYVGTPWMSTYFPHFDSAHIEHVWKMYNLQGFNSTFYIASAMCFESVLHVYEYGRLLAAKFRDAFSPDKKIAIIGAGPAGLLWSSMYLSDYKNITILEKSDRYGGKTRTEHHKLSDGTDVVCELGTCYLSAAYQHMVEDFKKAGFFKDSEEIGLGKYNLIRGHKEWRKVIIDGQAEKFNAFEKPIRSFESMYRYKALHIEIMGHVRPIPPNWDKIPQKYKDDMRLTFKEFLIKHNFSLLINSLLYAYQHQGYGKLAEIPALYGLIWVTPEVFHGILGNAILGRPSIVFCLKEGWLPIWDKAVESTKGRVKMILNAEVTKITRPGVD